MSRNSPEFVLIPIKQALNALIDSQSLKNNHKSTNILRPERQHWGGQNHKVIFFEVSSLFAFVVRHNIFLINAYSSEIKPVRMANLTNSVRECILSFFIILSR
jgi:hypothetical protein